MKAAARNSEKGQVLILIVLSVVAVLGFAALAIDGGMIYSERRVAQNAADAAAYAGAASFSQAIKNFDPDDLKCADFNNGAGLWTPASVKQQYANRAIARALDNTFTIRYEVTPANVTANDNAIWMECGSDSLGADYVDVHVRMTRQVRTSLMHLFYNGLAINTVDSVVRVYAPAGVATGSVIVSLCSHADDSRDGLEISGNATIDITIGKVVSNCDIYFGGTPDKITVPSGITYSGSVGGNLPPANKAPITQASPIAFPYEFGDELNRTCDAVYGNVNEVGLTDIVDSVTPYNPGKYADIVLHSGNIKLNPGLYCLYGSVDVNSSSSGLVGPDGVNYSLVGEGVTFYISPTPTDPNRSFSINGGTGGGKTAPGTAYLTAPSDGTGNGINGLLIWYGLDQTACNNGCSNNIVSLNGDGKSVFEGTIAAPLSDVFLAGNNGTKTQNYGVQVIADDIKITGNSSTYIYYSADKLFSSRTQIGMER